MQSQYMKRAIGYFRQNVKKYSDGSTIHGVLEAYYAKTIFSKLLWIIMLGLSLGLTYYQIQQIWISYEQNPTKTAIEFLDYSVPIQYAPLQFYLHHWSDWVNLTKVFEMGVTCNALLYVTSYFNDLLTTRKFDVLQAEQDLREIMKKNEIENLFQMQEAISSNAPFNIDLDADFRKGGWDLYVGYLSDSVKNSSNFIYEIKLKAYVDFRGSKFDRPFVKYFNTSFYDEFKHYSDFGYGHSVIGIDTITSLPVQFSPAGTNFTFSTIDPFVGDYEFYLKATLYRWMSTAKKNCSVTNGTKFMADCDIECFHTVQLMRGVTGCGIYFLSENSTLNVREEMNSVNNSCNSDMYFKINQTEQNVKEEKFSKCYSDCQSGCDKWKYEMTYLLIPKSKLFTNQDSTYTGSILIDLPQRDDTMVITLSVAYDWSDVVAAIGGLLGLWLGASIMSFIQVIYYFCIIPIEAAVVNWFSSRKGKISIKDNKDSSIIKKSWGKNDNICDWP